MIGAAISHYRILETLGRGGQATAFKAEDLRLTRPVVIKALRPELAASETARRRFEREACLCSALDNPHIQGVYDIGETDGLYYIVLAAFLAVMTHDVHEMLVAAGVPRGF